MQKRKLLMLITRSILVFWIVLFVIGWAYAPQTQIRQIPKANAAPIAQYTGGLLVYADGTAGTPKYQVFDDSTGFGSEQSASSVGANAIEWIRVAASPTNDEWIIATRDAGDVIKAQVCTGVDGGVSCGTPTTITSNAGTHGLRNYDVAYEQTSGDALLVYGTSTADELRKIEWTGGAWANDAAITTTRTSGTVEWVELTSRRSSDQIGIAYSDSNDDVSAYRWSGTAVGDEAAAAINTTASTADVRKFDISFEGTSGDMIVASPSATLGNTFVGQLIGNTWQAVVNDAAPDVVTGFIDLSEPNPSDNDIAMSAHGTLGASNVTEGYEWSGTGITDGNLADDAGANWAANYQLSAVTYFSSSAYGLGVFSNAAATDDIDWWVMSATGGMSDIAQNARTRGAVRHLDLFDYPNADKVLLLTDDANGYLWADTWDGTSSTATSWVDLTSGGALETSLATSTTDAVDFAFRVAPIAVVTTAGTTGSQTASLTVGDTNQYVGGAFSFSTTGAGANVTGITITESGTVDATNLDNVKLLYENDTSAPYDCASESYAGTETQYGSTVAAGFSAANGTATFAGSVAVTTTSTMCVYVVFDITSGSGGQTVEISIASTSDFTTSTGTKSGTPAISGTTTLASPITTTVSSSGTQTASLAIPSTNQFLGGAFTLTRSSGSANLTSIGITVSGTSLAASDISNMRLHYDSDATCSTSSFTAGVAQYGSTAASPTVGKNTFTGSIAISTTATCIYVVVDIPSTATDAHTIELNIASTSDVTVGADTISGTPSISGTTTINGSTTISATGTQTTSLLIPSTNQFVGGAFTLTRSAGSVNVTSITVTVNSATGLSNMDLYTDTVGSCSTADPVTNAVLFGTNATVGATTAITGSVAVTTTTRCFYVIVDVGSSAADAQTLEISIAAASDVTMASGNKSGSGAVSGTTTLNGTTTVAATGTQTTTLTINTANQFVGGAFTLTRSAGSVNVTTIKVTLSGTGLAASDIANMKLYTDTAATCNTSSFSAGQYGSTIAAPTVGSNTFSGSVAVGTSATCVYVVIDATSSAADNDTLEISIASSGDVTMASGTISGSFAVAVAGTSTFHPAGITISGNIYSDEGVTAISCAVAKTIRVKVNGAGSYSASCTNTPSNGYFSISGVSITSAGDVITAYISGATENASAITKAADTSSGITLNLYQNRIVIRNENGVATSNANLNQYDELNDSSSGDIGFTVDASNNLTVSSGWELYVISGKTYAPAANVTTPALDIQGTYTGASETLILNGTGSNTTCTSSSQIPLCIGGTFTPSSNTVQYSGATATVAATTFKNLTLGGTGTYTMPATSVNISGDFVIASGATVTKGAGTVTFNAGAAQTLTDNNVTSQDLGDVATSGASTNLQLGSNVQMTSLNIGASTTFTPASYTLELTGTGTPFSVSGTFTPGTSTIKYTGTSATVTATTFKNLTLGGTGTYTMPASTLTLLGNLSITSGATVTKGAGTVVFGIGGGGSQTLTDSTATKQDLGTIQISANTGNSTLNLGSSIKATTIVVDASQTFAPGSNTVTILGTGTAASRPFRNSGTFTATSSTVAYQGDGDTDIEAGSTTYNNLTLNPTISGSGKIYTFNGALTAAGNLDINPSAGSALNLSVLLGGTTSITGTLTIQRTSSATSSLSTNTGNYSLTASSISVGSGGTLTANNSTITISGSGTPFVASGTFNCGGSTVQYANTGSVNIAAATYKNLTLGAGASGSYTMPASTINIQGNFIASAGSGVTKGAGTVTFNGGAGAGSPQTVTDSAATKSDLGTISIAANTTLQLGSSLKATQILANAANSGLKMGSYSLTMTGSGTGASRPIQFEGAGSTFDKGSGGAVYYTGTSATEVEPLSYENLNLDPASAGNPTYTLGYSASQTISINVGLNIGTSNPVTVDLATYNPNTQLKYLTIASGSTYTKGSGTTTFIGIDDMYISDATASLQDLGNVHIDYDGITDSMLAPSTNLKLTSLTVDSTNITFNLGSNTMTMTGNGNVLTKGSGTFVLSSSTINFAPSGITGVNIPALSYNNIILNKAANMFTVDTGTFSAADVTITAGTLDLNTNDPTSTVSGTVTNGGTLDAPSANSLTIAGTLTNNGTFNSNNGTVIANPASASSPATFNGSNDISFYNFEAGASAPGKTIKFKGTGTYTFTNQFTLNGTSSGLITLDSTDASQWLISLQGTPSISFVIVKNAGCSASNNVGPYDSMFDGGGNDYSCWKFVARGGGGGNTAGGASGGGSGQTGGGNSGNSGDTSGGGSGQIGGGGGGGGGGDLP